MTSRPAVGPWRTVPTGGRRSMVVLDTLLRALPPPVRAAMALGLAWGWFQHWNHPRRCVIRAMERLGRPRPYWAAWRVFAGYALHLLDRYDVFVRGTTVRAEDDPAGRAALDRVMASGEPAVLLGSHLGALELAGALLAPTGREVVAVTAEDPGAAYLLRRVGDPAGGLGAMRTIVADGSPRSGLSMLQVLRGGGLLGIKADRALPGARSSDLHEVEFLGERLPLPLGPARLALAAGVRVVAVSVTRVGRLRYRVASRELAGRTPEELVEAYAAAMEDQVRACPDQWFNFHPLWPSDRAALAGVPTTVPPGLRRAGSAVARGTLWALALVAGGLGAVALSGAAVPTAALAAALVGLAGLLVGAAFVPGAQVFGEVTCRGRAGAVALTFDDGPDPRVTPSVLDALDRAGAKGTFFVLGRQVRRWPGLARAIVERGHELALHGDEHVVRRAFWRPALHRDLAAAQEAVLQICGRRPRLYRPPAGVVVPSLLDVARSRGLEVVGWSVRGRDGVPGSAERIVARVLERVGPGDVVLLHDAAPAGGPPATATALPEILDGLAARGLPAVTLSEVLGVDGEASPSVTGAPRARRTWQERVVGPALLLALAALGWRALEGLAVVGLAVVGLAP